MELPPLPVSYRALQVCLNMMSAYMFTLVLFSPYAGLLTRIVVSWLLVFTFIVLGWNFYGWIAGQ